MFMSQLPTYTYAQLKAELRKRRYTITRRADCDTADEPNGKTMMIFRKYDDNDIVSPSDLLVVKQHLEYAGWPELPMNPPRTRAKGAVKAKPPGNGKRSAPKSPRARKPHQAKPDSSPAS